MSRTAAGQEASEEFYSAVLTALNDSGVAYLVGGTCAINEYIGLGRPTKDLDVFCRAGDFPRLLRACGGAGFDVEVEDERWIGKIRRGGDFCDVVFGSANMVAPVTDLWFAEAFDCEMYGVRVRLLAPTELIWSKVFIMDRYKFDGNDVAHILLRMHGQIDWSRLLAHHDQHWEVLLMHLLRFRYIYPSERRLVPGWVMEKLLTRLALQEEMPLPRVKVCRGRMFSRDDFLIDITRWGYADVVGDAGELGGGDDQEGGAQAGGSHWAGPATGKRAGRSERGGREHEPRRDGYEPGARARRSRRGRG